MPHTSYFQSSFHIDMFPRACHSISSGNRRGSNATTQPCVKTSRLGHPAVRIAGKAVEGAKWTHKKQNTSDSMVHDTPRALVRRLLSVWDALQVELHGQYSRGHLLMLREYVSTKHSAARVASLLIVTPLPSLGVMLLFDTLPLAPPSLGTNENVGFWIRSTAVSFLFAVACVIQTCTMCPQMTMSRVNIVAAVVVPTIGTQLFGYALSLAIGFPVPFSLVLESPVGSFLLMSVMAPGVRRFIRSNPTAKPALRDLSDVSTLISSQLLVYPLCNFLFASAQPRVQPAVALLLSVVKVAYKNALNRCVREQPDLKAPMVNFHGEIFNSLFVTFSMQSATSFTTVAVLTLVDFLHACSTLYEADRSLQELEALEKDLVKEGRAVHGTNTVVDRVSAILEQREPRATPSCRSINAMPTSKRSWLKRVRDYTRRNKVVVLRPIVASSSPPPLFVSDSVSPQATTTMPPTSPVADRTLGATSDIGEPVTEGTSTPAGLSKTAKRNVVIPATSLTATAVEDAYVAKGLALLHLTEFVVLTEFVEVVVPVVYGKERHRTLAVTTLD